MAFKAITAWLLSKGSGGGTTPTNYSDLQGLPMINGQQLIGDKDSDELDLLGENDELDNEQMDELISKIPE